MTNHVALLRAVNVAGHGAVPMANLKKMFIALGFTNVQSLLQSGNIIFGGADTSTDDLERQLEKETAKRLKLATDYFVRDATQWIEIVSRNPFPDEALEDPSHLVAVALKSKVDAKRVTALRAAIKGRERVEAKGKTLYVVYPDGIGRSKLTLALIERALGCSGTGRNWNTVLKLKALVAGK